jgi:hypothetical protein
MIKPENSADAELLPLGGDEDESSQIRRLPSSLQRRRPLRHRAESADSATEARDTQPCAAPAEARSEPFNLERTLRFARLLRETLPPNQDVARLLDLAIMRRDAILLQSLMRHLYQVGQTGAPGKVADEGDHLSRRPRTTLLPPAPEHPVPAIDFKQGRRR